MFRYYIVVLYESIEILIRSRSVSGLVLASDLFPYPITINVAIEVKYVEPI